MSRTLDLMQAARAAGIKLNVRDGIVRLSCADAPTLKQWASILRPIKRQVLAWLLTEQAIHRARTTTPTKASP